MTLHEVYELTAYWEKHPPAHLLAGAYLGYRPRPPVAERPPAQAGGARPIGALLDLAKGGVCRVDQLGAF